MRGFSLLVLMLALGACGNYKTPQLSNNPDTMSADTLCFRYETTKAPALGAEIAARNLDCAGLLQDDPLVSGPDDAAYRLR